MENENLEGFVLELINDDCKKQESAAYFEIICSKLFREVNKENCEKLNFVLESLQNKNLISINGDRLSLTTIGEEIIEKKECDLLFIDPELCEIINNSGLNVAYTYADIGHGCNVLAVCGHILNSLPNMTDIFLDVGVKLYMLKQCYEGYKWLVSKLKEIKTSVVYSFSY